MLKKALYGLKQAPSAWNNRIDKYFIENNFTKCPYEHALYIKVKDGDILIMCPYRADLIFTRSNPKMFDDFKKVMTQKFEMTDIGLMAYYLELKLNKRKKAFSCPKKATQGRYSKSSRWMIKYNISLKILHSKSREPLSCCLDWLTSMSPCLVLP